MNLYLVLVTERVSSLGDSSSILKSFTFMDEEVANRFVAKIVKVQEEYSKNMLIPGIIESDIVQFLSKKYCKIPLNFHLITNIELKTLGKINVSLDFLECKSEEVI